MAFKFLILSCLVAVISAMPQHVAHSHAQITLNKASIHRDTLHETPVHHNVEPKYHHHVAPVVQHYSQDQQQSYSSNGNYGQQSDSSLLSHATPVVHVAPVVKHVAPVVHYAAPVAHVSSHSQSSSSHTQHHSAPAHYSTVAKVALAAPVVHYQHHSDEHHSDEHHSVPVAKLAVAVPVTKYVAAPKHYHHEEEEYGPAEYSFEYSVHDEHTGDIKSQKEERHGDQVTGSYMLIEPDGSRRIVEYTADKHSGFNAVVHREEVKHPQPVLKKIVAPVAVKYVAPAHVYHH